MRIETDRLIAEAYAYLKKQPADEPRHYVVYEGTRFPTQEWTIKLKGLYVEWEMRPNKGLWTIPRNLEATMMRGNGAVIEETFPLELSDSYTMNNADFLTIDVTFEVPIDLLPQLEQAVWIALADAHKGTYTTTVDGKESVPQDYDSSELPTWDDVDG